MCPNNGRVLPPEIVDGATFMASERLRWREKEFQAQVLGIARDFGWDFRYHTYFSDRSERGFPDLMLGRSRDGRMLVAELKTMKGRTTAAQEDWLGMFEIHQSRWLGMMGFPLSTYEPAE